MAKSADDRDGKPVSHGKADERRLAELTQRIERARARGAEAPAGARPEAHWGFAFRIVADLVAGILVGGVIGWQLDRWLGTTPILLIVFFLLGTAGGLLSVVRTVQRMPGGGAGQDKPRRDGRADRA